MTDVSALGGIGEYGRNCFLVMDQATNTRIMLDCGVRNGNPEVYPPITETIAQSIQTVFISHVHNDHIGALPLLAQKGFTGDVWMSEASFRQLSAILGKWHDPLINNLHFRSFAKHTRGQAISFTEDFSITWGYSGHMLGSVWYSLQLREKSIFFSGDIVLSSPLLVTDMPDKDRYEYALIDSGHAAQIMPYKRSLTNILSAVNDSSEKYFLPITISGKTCDLLFSLFQALPDRPFFIDEPLYEHINSYLHYPDNLRPERRERLQAMLQSKRLAISRQFEGPGIYLLENKPEGCHEINTNLYQGIDSFFYKSHPDKQDLKTLIRKVFAKKYIFFHSKQHDLDHILQDLSQYNHP
ncbi:MBL fold metallo-hydrolase [Gracilibacillus alcaliphilus]|uniref:MBL fold metallo-hydrolase n=1 Tax=Gracilibacillus alcaliphilus TaxID=1401441 RepID=UPI00195C1FB8|nr:MBL fold metallo-hydrolase [Gracilibacillus alcaliphilus]MBM7679037.1 Cft2 family RNA processing exonuclease [Gracilibacillus alcaliphilus]